MAREQLASIEDREAAREHYLEEDLSRPPFCYTPRPARFEQADERQVFEMEYRVFECSNTKLNLLPKPPEGLKQEAPLMRAYQYFNAAKLNLVDLTRDIQAIKSRPHLDTNQTILKTMLANHHKAKVFYLNSLKAYLSIYQRTPGTKERDEAKELFNETETIFLAHQVYVGVRSFTHDHGPLRENKDTVMKHVYDVAISIMNYFIGKLAQESDPTKREQLFQRMKENLVVGLAHDLKEDHRNIPLDTMYTKLISLVDQDSRLTNLIHAPDLEGGRIRHNINFLQRHRRSIKPKLIALTKPEQESEQKGYMTRQLVHGRFQSEVHRTDTMVIKLLDRLSNITDLESMTEKRDDNGRVKETRAARQNRKIMESTEVIQIAYNIYEKEKDEDLLRLIQVVCTACLKESDRIQTQYGVEMEEQRLGESVTTARNLIKAQLLSTLKAA